MLLHFLLNDRQVKCEVPAGLPVLDWLRQEQGLTATKRGCGEGDCGACSVLLGIRRSISNPLPNTSPESERGLVSAKTFATLNKGDMEYRPVNSCLLPMGALAGRHLITLEGISLKHSDNQPMPVQQYLVEEGGIQCGFCTPGMVINLLGHLLNNRDLSVEQAKEALDGNLCRCTGYMGIKRAAQRLADLFPNGLPPRAQRVATLIQLGLLPGYFTDIPQRLAKLPQSEKQDLPNHGDTIIAGGTDLMLHATISTPSEHLWFLRNRPDMTGITIDNGLCSIGAATTMESLLESDLLAEHIPHVHSFLAKIAATPVRDRATLGGNLVNASPIGDLSVCLLALDAQLLLSNGEQKRRLPLKGFFTGYKQLDKQPDELLEQIEFPLPEGEILFNFEKVAHRQHVDIAAVNSAMHLRMDNGIPRVIRLSAGGVAATPVLLPKTAACLSGEKLNLVQIRLALQMTIEETSPIDDLRGSARYKQLLLHRLILAHLIELIPEQLPPNLAEELL